MSRALLTLCLMAVACSGEDGPAQAESGGPAGSSTQLSGTIKIDGSSTVFPITEAVAEEYGKLHRRVRVTVGVSGTGGGMEKFAQGETSLSGASRPIKQKERDACAANAIEWVELPVAYDGIAVVVHTQNTFAKHMTVEELRRMWSADSGAKNWSDIRSGWPERPFRLYAPGQDSGTFDYFTETVNGEGGNCRSDATFSEDDNVLVRGVSGDKDGIGFFGFAYYHENSDKLNVLSVDGGQGPVTPSLATISDGSYSPLSRPLFIYVNTREAQRPEVDAFVEFYLDHGRELAGEVGYVPLPIEDANEALAKYRVGKLGA